MRLLRRIIAGSAGVALVVVMSACGGDDTAAPTTSPVTTSPATTSPVTTAPDTTSPVTTSPVTTTPVTTTPVTTVPPTAPATTPAPTTTVAPTTVTPTTAPPTPVDVRVYFLRDERLVIAHRDVAGPAVLRGAMEALLAGPTAAEHSAGMASAVPAGTELRSVNLADGRATVDLTADYGTGGGSLSMMARVAQVVFTATQFPNVDEVVFWIDGEPVDALGGEGLVLIDPQSRASVNRDLTGAVIVDTPQPGATVTSPIRITGEADVFEGQFPIEIWRDGVQIGGATGVWGGAWGDWRDFDVTIELDAAPGPIEIVAYDVGGCGDAPECSEPIRTVVTVELAP